MLKAREPRRSLKSGAPDPENPFFRNSLRVLSHEYTVESLAGLIEPG